MAITDAVDISARMRANKIGCCTVRRPARLSELRRSPQSYIAHQFRCAMLERQVALMPRTNPATCLGGRYWRPRRGVTPSRRSSWLCHCGRIAGAAGGTGSCGCSRSRHCAEIRSRRVALFDLPVLLAGQRAEFAHRRSRASANSVRHDIAQSQKFGHRFRHNAARSGRLSNPDCSPCGSCVSDDIDWMPLDRGRRGSRASRGDALRCQGNGRSPWRVRGLPVRIGHSPIVG
jgi:hypothetical protein